MIALSSVTGDQNQKDFYDTVYGVVENPQKVLHQLLDFKEVLSWNVCKHAFSYILGMECSLRTGVTR